MKIILDPAIIECVVMDGISDLGKRINNKLLNKLTSRIAKAELKEIDRKKSYDDMLKNREEFFKNRRDRA